jgi:hypothetical protein
MSEAGKRLAGHWVHEEFYGGGSSEVHMVLGLDGRCLRGGSARASLSFSDGEGNWAGSMDASSGSDAGESGSWTFDGRVLALRMENGDGYEYTVELSGASMLTRNTSDGGQRLWTCTSRP